MHLILAIIRPTFKHIISPACLHLAGPSAIKKATRLIKTALKSGRFKYCLRIDISSYYSSIDHRTLIKLLTKHFADSIIRKHLVDIVTIGIDRDGQVFLPNKGIPRQSVLSPFFGALYLSALDEAFTRRKGCFYLRFMDDGIILVETKRQYAKARKRLFAILQALRLKVSPHKTKMGALRNGFHFLGVKFELSRNNQKKTQEVVVDVHERTPRRALDKIKAMRLDAVNPAKMQRYLIRWASWWHHAVGLYKRDLIKYWISCADETDRALSWLGSGLVAFDNIPGYGRLSWP